MTSSAIYSTGRRSAVASVQYRREREHAASSSTYRRRWSAWTQAVLECTQTCSGCLPAVYVRSARGFMKGFEYHWCGHMRCWRIWTLVPLLPDMALWRPLSFECWQGSCWCCCGYDPFRQITNAVREKIKANALKRQTSSRIMADVCDN